MVTRQTPTIVGRDREIEQLRHALDQALQGQAGLVLIGGEAGIGKTTLAGMLADEARARDVAVFFGYCDEFDMVPPYGPWLNAGLLDAGDGQSTAVPPTLSPERQRILEFLRRHGPARPAEAALELGVGSNAAAQTLRRMHRDGLIERPRYGYYSVARYDSNGHSSHSSRHTPGTGTSGPASPASTPGLEPDEQSGSLIIIDRLRDLCSTGAVMVVLEDLHWSDEASLVLASSVAQQLSQQPLLVVLTYRHEELPTTRPLHRSLPTLLRKPQTLSLHLRRLDEPAIRELVTRRYNLPDADESRAAEYLHRYAEGNPFFTEELLRALEAGDVLRHTVFGWSLAGLPQFRVPPILRQLLATQIEQLDEGDRGLLQVAAVIGPDIPYDLWLTISAAPEHELADTIERSMQVRLIEETSDRSGLRFRHALIRETLYDQVILPRRRAWHRLIGETLANTPDTDPELIAHHFSQASDGRATAWLIRAGRRAARASAYTTAATLLEQALAVLVRDDERVAERGWLLCEMAEYFRYVDQEKALALLESARAIAARTGDAALQAVLTACRGRILSAHSTPGLEEFRRALIAFDALPAEDRQRVLESPVGYLLRGGTFGQWLTHYGYFAEALPILERAVAADTDRQSRAETYDSGAAHFGLGITYSALGDPGRAQHAYATARFLQRSLGNSYVAALTLNWELETIYMSYYADRPGERQQLLREQSESFQGSDFQIGFASEADILDGHWEAVRASVAALEHVDALRVYHARLLAELDRLQGHYAHSWSHITGAIPDGPDAQPPTYQFHNILDLQQIAAALALDQGDLETAVRWIQAHERWLEWSCKVSGRAMPHLLWSRYHLLAGELDAAHAQARAAHELASSPRQALALLASERALGEIQTLKGSYDTARRHLNAALDLARACAAPYEHAMTLLAVARLDLASDRSDAARSALDEAETICSQLGARPALAEIVACRETLPSRPSDSGLSARELDVLRLVSEGLTDREVAERLYVSPRTINQHLRSIYNKLGVNSRTAATRIALERGIV